MSSDSSGFFLDFLFGGIAATFTKTLIAPIERVQVLLQTQDVHSYIQGGSMKRYEGIMDCLKRVTKDEGFFSLWRGNYSNILRYFPAQALNFAIKDSLKLWFCPYDIKKHPWKFFFGSLLSGGFAGAISVTIIYPLDFLRTRLAADIGRSPKDRQFNGNLDCLQKVYNKDGIKGIYKGVVTSAVMYFFYRAIYFGGYDSIKNVVLVKRNWDSRFNKLMAAFFVTNVAGIIVFPLDTVRRRLMMQAARKTVLYNGAWECIKKILKNEGPLAFYKGGLSNVLRGSGSSLILVIYDEFQKLWLNKPSKKT